MALGDVSFASNVKRTIELGAFTADVAAPALATAGVPTYPPDVLYGADKGCFFAVEAPEVSLLTVKVTGTTPTAIVTLYGYLTASDSWHAIPVNGGVAVTSSFQALLPNLGHFDRLTVGAASVGGTTPAFDCRLTTCRRGY
jgi:hypothetical protein